MTEKSSAHIDPTPEQEAMLASFLAYQQEEDYEAAQLQDLIDKGIWSLEGSIGRAMMRAIEDGRCVLGPEPAWDYWGARIPSRYEVKPGTKGSVEYAMEAMKNAE